MKRKVVSLISKLLAVTAILYVSTASIWAVYQPEVPEELKTKH